MYMKLMAKPGQLPLCEEGKQAGNVCLFQDVLAGDTVFPRNAKDASKAAEMKVDYISLLVGVYHAIYTTVQESAQHTGSAHCDLGSCDVFVVLPHSFGQFCHDCSSSPNSLAELWVKG